MIEHQRSLIRQLEVRIARQREEGGDMMTYGQPDPLDVALLAFLKGLQA